MARAKIIYDFEASSAKLVSEIQKASTHIKGMHSGIEDMKKSLSLIKIDSIINLGERAFQAGRQVYDFAKSIASAGNDIQRMSKVFNMTTDDFQKWSYVAKMADVDVEGFGNAFKFLTRSLSEALQGTGDAAKAFNLLGINLKDASGKTKDQQTIMMETIGALEKYAEGVNRDALMLAIFGRGWMSIKPLVDQGTKTIEENRLELERLNGVLGKDTIKSLSESEDAFKRWEFTWKVAKSETFAPMVEIFGSMLERIMALKRAWAEGGLSGVIKDVLAAQEEEKIRQTPSASWTKEWVAGWTPPKKTPPPEAPGLPGGEVKPIQLDLMGEKALEEGVAAYGKAYGDTYKKIVDTVVESNKFILDNQETTTDFEIKTYEERGEALLGYAKNTEELAQITKEQTEVDRRQLSIMNSLRGEYANLTGNTQMLIEVDKEHTELTIQRLGLYGQEAEAMRMVAAERQRQMTDTYKFTQDLNRGMENSFSSFFQSVFDKTKSWKEKMSGLFQGLADSFIKALSDMAAKQLATGLFGGSGGGGTDWGGLIGGVIRGVSSFISPAPTFTNAATGAVNGAVAASAEGGIFKSPQVRLIGEEGPEAVIPLDRLEKGNKQNDQPPSITNINIMTLDVSTMEQWVRKNSRMFVDVMIDNIRRGGQLGKAVRGA